MVKAITWHTGLHELFHSSEWLVLDIHLTSICLGLLPFHLMLAWLFLNLEIG